MPNEFISSEQVVADMLKSARKNVAGLPVEDLRKLAKQDRFWPGFHGAIEAACAIAARERLQEMGLK